MSHQVETGVLSRSDGSAQLTIGSTKVITSVNGPTEPKARQELPNLASLEIVIRPAQGLPTTREKLLEDKLRSLLQTIIIRYKYPRQLIQIVVQFLSSEGKSNVFTNNELSAAINCAFYALIDANIALNYSFAAVSVSLNEGKYLKDPAWKQLSESDSHHVICFSIQDGKAEKLLLLESQGDFSEEEVFDTIAKSVAECEKVHQDQRKFIGEKIDRDFIWKA
ncbi:ribosomal protein S5 domain 2-like protein [Suhomyces tanzawaensis NRRL Y-17324]|uniref:Ribosomal protein S5 domain 2-like protein n=1 Tax=Suhomyces tanzawaensis NRRL Y-17324 TaxID=984487 RepID=A0A1E4SRF0_9ASCO|nr:ribosomal protein S5 domain 2-like protein [Suhomyces tanzawaensis NRRL Y-17324]ODV81982.1 ribosomal protein S5 domain 2-like protein [Suhomyces tanzawaensis NRRL Y-17324]